ncbi:EexN family lipoprotein [uncultured Psychrobacter sp.]|uniref:EexN family lipoprotein n=1 Tax=uncultured Psychrobacter sp. TaxID=259303 RepID=UPI0030DD8A69
MKALSSVMVAVLAVLALTGCGEEEVRTTRWYQDNPDEIKKVQERCKAENEKGYKVEGALKENCDAARRARSIIIRDNAVI